MKLKAAIRVYNEEYYLNEFIRYNLTLGIEELHFFDSCSTDKTLKIINKWEKKSKGAVKLIKSSPNLRHTSDSRETEVCNMVLQHAVSETKEEATWWLFLDADEFIQPVAGGLKPFLADSGRDQIRIIFYDWYLSAEQAQKNPPLKKILQLLKKGKLKGRILKVLDDPFYKDYLLLIHPEDQEKFKKIRTVAGNHRYLHNNQVKVPPNDLTLVCNHIRGVASKITLSRIEGRMELLSESYAQKKDHWTYEHFLQVKEELKDYEAFYNQLKTVDFLEKEREATKNFDSNESLFDKIFY